MTFAFTFRLDSDILGLRRLIITLRKNFIKFQVFYNEW